MITTVSIITPVYNVEKYIVDAIESVRSQTFKDWELLLVDDGSTDGSRQKIEKYLREFKEPRIRLIQQPRNQGAAAARNRGLWEATSRYIAYLDADDIWRRDKLEKELAFMEETGAAFAFTGYEFADESGKGTGRIVKVPESLKYGEALKNTTIFTTTVMFDTEKIEKQLLTMPLIESEDTALWWKVLRKGFIAYGLNENLAWYRRTEKSLSSNKLKAIRRIWGLYRKAEKLSVIRSMYYFCFWAVNALARRI